MLRTKRQGKRVLRTLSRRQTGIDDTPYALLLCAVPSAYLASGLIAVGRLKDAVAFETPGRFRLSCCRDRLDPHSRVRLEYSVLRPVCGRTGIAGAAVRVGSSIRTSSRPKGFFFGR